ncbi:serine hydroxymethyltransferase [Candidatus Nesciobacter abundans]|uniref:Serine hydroxymethyltransferase n=2 Tax=Candidatus Nesciobacter abundans TaxID=2601668 RepID=A0A5C0UHR4_9PROT|nr:serine hydroxymethyltransferase [Candidatus Nesciobacter abundans]QEK39103.1 serine hydroxymethyltransferase [Candidatus Nesciobacter abundans]
MNAENKEYTNKESIFQLIKEEEKRQKETLSLIASENITSKDVMIAQGSCLTNKYAEGYSGKRYYGGCTVVDKIEERAIENACALFGAKHANVQPHSGSQANMGVFFGLLNPGDTILGMSLQSGGHLTHGFKVNFSGQFYNSISYGVNNDGIIDMNEVRDLAIKHKPKMIIAGISSYSRILDWKKFRSICDEVGAILLCDIAHVSGLIAAKEYPNPIHEADVVTSTTHKTLRGPRGGLILTNNSDIFNKINKGTFPAVQGGPMMHSIAAKAICFESANQENFKNYIKDVIKNAQLMADELSTDFEIISGGTDTHMFVVKLNDCSGKEAQKWLEESGIIVNKNTVPNDKKSPAETSGIRIGTPSCSSRKVDKSTIIEISRYIKEIINSKGKNNFKSEIEKICYKFPILEF